MRFIVIMGLVSLFADAAYEGARSIVGAYMAYLGAAPAVVGIVAGGGELLGYLARAGFGPLADRTRRYWLLTGVGYAVNLLSIPAMGLVRTWQAVAGLVLTERLGKAVRTPARDAMLSRASQVVGEGWGFGVHEALDQIGAVVGPLLLALVLASGAAYGTGFLWLTVPVGLALATLAVARSLNGKREKSESTEAGREELDRHDSGGSEPGTVSPEELPRGVSQLIRGTFGLYILAAALSAAGLADFALVAFHAQRRGVLSSASIPLVFAAAMAIDGASALGFGRLFDKIGLGALCLALLVSAPFAAAAFSSESRLLLGGVLLWGIGLGAHESIMRSGVATLTPEGMRGSAYGLFGAVFGVAWFIGSALMGFLYGISLSALVAFSVGCQAGAVGILAAVWIRKEKGAGLSETPMASRSPASLDG